MIDALRTALPDGTRYAIAFPQAGTHHLLYRWPERIDETLGRHIIELMRDTSASAPIIGFAEEIGEAEATAYLQELSANVGAGKCRLLTVWTDGGLLVGLCTLRRNLNPNNRHITDLAKGMIREKFRGGLLLPAAFHEIALRCEADGVEILTLDVRADTHAQRTWERFGFKTWGVFPDYARAQGTVHAGHYMLQPVAELKQRVLAALLQRLQRDRAFEAASA